MAKSESENKPFLYVGSFDTPAGQSLKEDRDEDDIRSYVNNLLGLKNHKPRKKPPNRATRT